MVVIMKEGALVGSEVFPPGTYRLGRAPGEDLQLDDPAISGHHASFALRNGQIGIRDDGSANGLFVNGKKVSVVRVTSKDEVQVGAYTLKMRVLEKSDPAPAGEPVDATVEATVIQAEPRARRPVPATTPPSPARLDRPSDEDATSIERDAFPAPTPVRKPTPDILTPRPMPNRGGKGAAAVAAKPVAKPAGKPIKPGTQPSVRLKAADRPEDIEFPESEGAPEAAFEPPTDVPVPRKIQAKPRAQPQPRGEPQPQAKPQAQAQLQPWDQPRARVQAKKAEPRLKAAPRPPGQQAQRPRPPPGPMPEVATTGAPVLRAHLVWGDAIIHAQTLLDGTKLRVGARDSVLFPLYGWPLPKKVFTLSSYEDGAWQVNVPTGVEAFQIEAEGAGGNAIPSWSNAGFEHGGSFRPMVVQRDGDGLGKVTLKPGEGVRLVNGRVSVELRSEMPSLPVPFSWKPKLDPSVLYPFIGTFILAVGFLVFMPKRSEMPDFNPKALPALRAILQPPKKKEATKTKLEKKAEKIVEEKKIEEHHVKHETPRQTAHKEVSLPVPQSQAVAAMQRILKKTAATQQLFSAVSKIGRGGGANFKASGLIGKVPLSFGGPGGFAIGGAFGKGGSTHGSAFYGLGGIGAPGGMGRGRTGKSGVQGGVASAPSHGARVQGLLPMEAVRKVVDQHISEVQECYENGLIRNPGLSGKLVVEWTIGTNGRVSKVGTKVATLQSNAVADCIIGRLKGWVFPRPTGGTVIVSYPFIFKSVGG
jgi:hypothetical protein